MRFSCCSRKQLISIRRKQSVFLTHLDIALKAGGECLSQVCGMVKRVHQHNILIWYAYEQH